MHQEAITLNRSLPPRINQAILPAMPKVEEINLPTGMRLFLLHDRQANGTRIEFVFPAGTSWHHNPLAALFALNLLRDGAKSYPGSLLMRRLDALGAFVEFQASADYAWMTAYIHQNKTGRLLPYVCAMLTEPEYRQKPFELYRQRQLARFNTDMLRTRTLAQRAFREHLFGSQSPYGKVTELTHFGQLQTNDLQLFHHLRYNPRLATVIIAGNIRTKWIGEIEKRLPFNWGESAELVRQQIETQNKGLIFVDKANALQSSIVIGQMLVERNHPDYPAITLVNTILGGYFGSRLMSNLREDKGFTYGIYSQIVHQQLATYLNITTDVGSAVTADALGEIRREMYRLKHEPVAESELELVKNYLSGTYAQAIDGIFNQAVRLRGLIPVGLRLDYYRNLLEKIHQTSSNQIMEAAQRYFDPETMLVVVAGAEVSKQITLQSKLANEP